MGSSDATTSSPNHRNLRGVHRLPLPLPLQTGCQCPESSWMTGEWNSFHPSLLLPTGLLMGNRIRLCFASGSQLLQLVLPLLMYHSSIQFSSQSKMLVPQILNNLSHLISLFFFCTDWSTHWKSFTNCCFIFSPNAYGIMIIQNTKLCHRHMWHHTVYVIQNFYFIARTVFS